ncbi:protein argonaute-2-like isoform X1 [Odontomachus brunneus]|uniref:protein argonaute-2-like isoform X1 n=1 Tax=Odontomachus brunneus TaxID=486640 RepID=UPI0013F27DA0|nr:protein argonaute-2-like isoform X1 [Odontomachus brunneus]
MVKKGKKKQHAQAAAASTSSTDPIPSTSRQHPSQQTPPPQQQKKQKKKQEPQQQSQQELQQSQKELQKSQQKSQQQQQPQQQRPQQQQPQQQQPQQQQPQQQQPQQQQPQQQQPQQQQPQQQQPQQQQPQQQQPQQQQPQQQQPQQQQPQQQQPQQQQPQQQQPQQQQPQQQQPQQQQPQQQQPQQQQPQQQQPQQQQPQQQQPQQQQPQQQQPQQQQPQQQQPQQQQPQQQQPQQQQPQQQQPQQQQPQQQQPQQQQPQQQQPQQQQPQQQQPQQQQPQQQQPQQQQPQQQQPQQQQPQQQQPQQQQPQQQQSQLGEESKPRAWRPSRMQHPPPFQQRQPQVTQIQEWSAQQFPTPQQVSDPHMQQFTSQSVPAWGLPCGQLPPQQRVTQQQAIRAQYPQQQVPQQTHMQPAWSRPPVPHPQQPLGWMPLPPTQQFMPQQTFQQQTRVVPPQQSTPQVMQQQPAWVSYPSTSTQQVLGIGDSGAQTGRTTGKDERTEKSDTSRMVPPMTSASSELARGMSQLMLEKKDKRMSEKDLNIPKRRNPYKAGTVGTPIRVKTNMFEIIFRDDFVTTAVHYDIKVVPIDNAKFKKDDSRPKREIKNKTLLRKIFEKWRVENYPDRYPAYDGMANVFAAREFPFIDTWFGEVNIHDDERDENRSFEITINKAGTVDLSWMKTMRPGLPEMDMTRTAVQILDIILRHAPASRLISVSRGSVGKSLFPAGENRRVKALGSGLDLHVGGFLSAVIGWRPYLNIDVAHKAFVASENVVDIICDILQMKTREDLNSRNARDAVTHYEDKINKVLTGVKVNYAIPNQPSTKRTHRINGLGPDAINHKFDVKGKMCSIQEYFATVKNCKLNFPHLPCLWVGKRDGKTYLPAELCKVAPGQAVNRKLDESQTTQMIKYAATKTDDRIEKIRRAFNGICVNDSHVMQNEFHLQVAAQMKEVDARILIPPALQYNDRAPALVSKGVWRAKRFSKPAKLEDGTWTIANVCYKNIDRNLPDFVDVLRNQASYFGMTVGKAQLPYPTVKPVPHEIERFFSNMRDLKLIIVILPDRTDAVYGTVKKISELRVGVLTQCIKMKNVLYPNNSTISNILLKINSKLNGINHTFTQNTMPYCLRGKNYMLIGADVSHPSPDAKDIPSVAAVAASHDETTFKYNVTIRLQQPKQEEISDLKEIMIKHIQFYVKEMKMPPQIIIFYRDGVSEGQIAMVLDKEIRSIKDACREYARERPGFNPQLTFVIVQKRHHVRLFPTRDQDSDDRNRNVKAGTIVDTEITHPNHIDFYLVSHASIQGTARPTKYRCICNESNFTEDHLEELTYHLCHMYARCTRSVSYPAPTYYAHLAAYRGRMWIQGKQYTEVDLKDKNKCKLEPLLKMPMSFI